MKEKIKKILNKKWGIKFFEDLSSIVKKFSITEKAIFYVLSAILIISGLKLLENANINLMINMPANGGYLKEGIIGSPRFVNPVLAVSDVDKDLCTLVYSGLMKVMPDNSLKNDLAENYQISNDGLEYLFTIRNNAYFSDGVKITADDVEFTIEKIQDSTMKSPLRPAFYDVKVQKISDEQIKFILKQPYAPFLGNLTVGILPKHLWNNLSSDEFPQSQYNVEPIGSGPYKINKMETLQKNMLLIPTYYELIPNQKYVLGKPFIDKLIINFYRDEDSLISAYKSGDVEAINSISPDKVSALKQNGNEIMTSPLPRIFAVFFNQNQSEVLALKEVRAALNIAVNRKEIVNEVLAGYGTELFGPIPKGLMDDTSTSSVENYNPEQAVSILTKAGWTKNSGAGIMEKKISKNKTIQLKISISTLNNDDLVKTARLLKADWEKIGASVDIKQFEFGDLEQNVIRPRKFEALLYGEVVGRDMDFFAFWHSSQRNDPGLNISMYANSKVDKLLEDARKTQDIKTRTAKYEAFESEIEKDIPAVFLYSPEFIYIVPDKIKNLDLGTITYPFERFSDINEWYIETNNIWKIFQGFKI